jgi:hypothetical protein
MVQVHVLLGPPLVSQSQVSYRFVSGQCIGMGVAPSQLIMQVWINPCHPIATATKGPLGLCSSSPVTIQSMYIQQHYRWCQLLAITGLESYEMPQYARQMQQMSESFQGATVENKT